MLATGPGWRHVERRRITTSRPQYTGSLPLAASLAMTPGPRAPSALRRPSACWRHLLGHALSGAARYRSRAVSPPGCGLSSDVGDCRTWCSALADHAAVRERLGSTGASGAGRYGPSISCWLKPDKDRSSRLAAIFIALTYGVALPWRSWRPVQGARLRDRGRVRFAAGGCRPGVRL
jgi:hypothetical protein